MPDLLRVCCKPVDHGPMSNIMSRLMRDHADPRDILFYVFDDGPAAIAIGDKPGQVYSGRLAAILGGRRFVGAFDPFDVDDYEIMWARLPERVRYTTSYDARTSWINFGLEFGTTNPPRPFRNARRRP